MAGLREIQSRIKSIQDTRKITNAMYMISSTKMKKARQALESTEPYFYALQSAMARIMRHVPELDNQYLEKEGETRSRIGLLVISGDKGLAGSYNHNVLKMAQQFLDDTDKEVELFVVGELGRQYFSGRGVHIEENFQYTAQHPTFSRARWIRETLLEKYQSGQIQEIHVIYTRMENSFLSETEDSMLLPLRKPSLAQIPANVYQEDFLLQPSPEEAIDRIVLSYMTGFIYGALVESFCSEQNARMVAMEAATNNADELLHDLGIMLNRARQAAITQEITEVCSGARAQKQKTNQAKEMQI